MNLNASNLELLKPGKLVLCQTDVDARPISWVETDGSRHGFEPAMARLIGDELGLEIEWLDVTRWEDFPAALADRRCDAILCNQAITPERRERYAFTRPYGLFAEAVLTRRGAGIHTDADLEGKVVAAIPNSTNLHYARSIPGTREVRQVDTSSDFVDRMVASLTDGEVDGFVEDELFLERVVQDRRDVEIGYVTSSANPYGIALRHGDGYLLAALDVALNRLLDSGRLEKIWDQWFGGSEFRLRSDETAS